MNRVRRTLLQVFVTSGSLAVLALEGLMRPLQALAAEWNAAGFAAKTLDQALARSGAANAVESPDILIKAPTIAEDGAVVPIEAISHIPGTTRLIFLVDKNPSPLVGSFDFFRGALPEMAIRLKFGETSLIRVVAVAEGRFYFATREVKVTAGGCGG